MIIPKDCKGCGKCCEWVKFKDEPIHYMCKNCNPAHLLLYYGKCQYLDDNNECTIYEKGRPNGCIFLERGSEDCIIFLQSYENINS